MREHHHPERASDESLRDRFLRDPGTGWDAFWEAYRGSLETVVRKYRFSREDAQDVLQEIALHLAVKDFHVIRGWSPELSSLSGYLSVVARHVCLSYLRSSFYRYTKKKLESASRGMEVIDLLESLESPADSPSRSAHRHQVIEVLECVLERLAECDHLRPLDRQVILLRAKGESYEHIAELLSISKANAMTRFSRIKQELREQLLKEGVGPADTAG